LGAAGPGRGPGATGAVGAAEAVGTAGAVGAVGAAEAVGAGAACVGTTGGGGGGTGATGFGAVGTAAEVVTAPPSVAAGAAAGAAASAGAFAAAAFSGAFAGAAGALLPPNDSRSRRATGASTVDDADLTNSPCSLSRARTSLLVTPSSFANSCTRALPATTSPSLEATAVGRPRLGFSYDAWSSGLHGVLMFFATCSFSPGGKPCEMLDHRGGVRCTGDAQRSAEGVPPNRR